MSARPTGTVDDATTGTAPVVVPLPAAGGGCPAIDYPASAWIRLATAADGTTHPVGLLFDGTWRLTAQPPADAVTGGILVMGPRHLVVPDALLAYDMVAGRWLRLPPLPDGGRTGVSASWSGGRLYVWGGRRAHGSVTGSGWMFTPDLPRGTFRAPGGDRAGYGTCGDVGFSGNPTLRADPHDPGLVWFEGSHNGRPYRLATTWPDGFLVRFRSGRAAVVAPDGTVVAREGQHLRDIDASPCFHTDRIAF